MDRRLWALIKPPACRAAANLIAAVARFCATHTRAERSFGAVVGGLNALVFKKSKQSLVVLEQSRGKIADLAVGTVQMPLGQDENPLFDRDRT